MTATSARAVRAVRPTSSTSARSSSEAHGSPGFVKIDVEGMEHEALAGLSVQLPALSFVFLAASHALHGRAFPGWKISAVMDTVWR
jgi:hypothetical protein